MSSEGRLILAGGGGFARELASWADHCRDAGSLTSVAGFIDDRSETMQGHDTPWLGHFATFEVKPEDRFLLAVGNPVTKARMAQSLRERGGKFASLIHPSVVLGRNHRHGEGIIMAPFSMNTSDTALGDFVTILSFSGLGHDASVGDFTTISSHVDVMGGASLGKRVMVGSGARIMPNVHVADDARIGAAALVLRRVPAGATMFTPSAKRLRLGDKPAPSTS